MIVWCGVLCMVYGVHGVYDGVVWCVMYGVWCVRCVVCVACGLW